MEINLELPSSMNVNNNPNSMESMDVQDSTGVHSCIQSDNVHEVCERNANGSVNGNVEQFSGMVVVNEGFLCEPRDGMEFESKEAAYCFYREYARSVGFGITIRASRRSKKSGKFIDVKIACSRFGSKHESGTTMNPRSCPKTGCKAGMHMKRREDEKWVIYSFMKEHNHEICPDDHYMGSKRKNKQAGALTRQKKGLQLVLDEGDVELMLEHFMSMQDENPGFFYAVDLDNEKHVRNVFWADAKARHDYCNFSDVVFFDTSYVRNKYKIPFAPFVGVNHHCHYILLGCALIGEENTTTFSWLMRTWLKAVGGQVPKVIITDQDQFLSGVVREVFPDTRHCFCLWHVLSKIPRNLGCVVNQYEKFMKKFSKCIHYSWTDEQFERRWWKLVGKFELWENEWIRSLYEDRKKWVPCYLQGTCLAEMSTAERSGSIASYFDRYMRAEATFKEFIREYTAFLQDRFDAEAKADLETRTKQPALRSLSPFEKQLSVIYTDTAFKKFQVELLGVVSCQLQKESEDGMTDIFCVEDFEERQNFHVAWKEAQLDVSCSCRLFEYRGFLCKHTILVLQNSGVVDIPSRYILRRWSKDANKGESRSENCGRLQYRIERFNYLCRRAIKLGEIGSSSEEAYGIAFKVLEETLKHCVDANNSVRSLTEPNRLAAYGYIGVRDEDQRHGTPNSSKKKKICRKRKVRSGPDGVSSRSEDSYHHMEQANTSARNLDNCYVPQQEVEEMELDSRASDLDSYHGSQQTVQGVGQLTSISPIRDGYYDNQSAMQAMGNFNSERERNSHYETQQSVHGVVQGQIGFRASAIRGCFNIEETLQDMTMESSQFQSTPSRHPSDKHLSR